MWLNNFFVWVLEVFFWLNSKFYLDYGVVFRLWTGWGHVCFFGGLDDVSAEVNLGSTGLMDAQKVVFFFSKYSYR